jgi:hypothetical protein
MSEALNQLKTCIKSYQSVDNQLRSLNKTVYTLREDRRCLELEMSEIVKLPQFANVNTLKIDDDGSTIQIQRPMTWSKPWSLSKKELSDLLTKFFPNSSTGKDCYEYILAQKKVSLVSQDFNFNRKVPEEDSEE